MNPKNLTSEEIITTDKYLQLAQKLPSFISYIKTDALVSNSPIVWRGKTHTFSPNRIWITGHSDYSITPELYTKFFEPNTKHWMGINMDIPNNSTDHKITKLPLGITNDSNESPMHAIFGNTNAMVKVSKEPRHIRNLVYMNFNQSTFDERRHIFSTFSTKPWVTCVPSPINTLEGRESYLRDIRNHKFVLCPRGNGVDTHRLWETLYMGSIPIVKRDTVLDFLYDELPICWIDSWDQVDEMFLDNEYKRITEYPYWNFEKLLFSYWERKILHIVNAFAKQ